LHGETHGSQVERHALRLRVVIECRVGEKVPDDLDVLGRLLPKRHVATGAEGDPPRPLDTVEQGRNTGIRHLVVGTVDDERGAGNSVQLGDNGPVLERARHVELVDSEPERK